MPFHYVCQTKFGKTIFLLLQKFDKLLFFNLFINKYNPVRQPVANRLKKKALLGQMSQFIDLNPPGTPEVAQRTAGPAV